jgi:hypothetical protein
LGSRESSAAFRSSLRASVKHATPFRHCGIIPGQCHRCRPFLLVNADFQCRQTSCHLSARLLGRAESRSRPACPAAPRPLVHHKQFFCRTCFLARISANGPPETRRLGPDTAQARLRAEGLDAHLVCLDSKNDLSSTATSSMLALLLKTSCSCQHPLQVSARRDVTGARCRMAVYIYPDRSIDDTPHKAGSQ